MADSETDNSYVSQDNETVVKNCVDEANEKFLSREPIVLVAIIGLALSNGINMGVQLAQIYGLPFRFMRLWNVFQSAVSVPAIIFFAIVSEIKGRKIIFKILFILSIFSSILHASARRQSWIVLGFVIQCIVKDGTLFISALSISEYCSPKHRLTYMLAQVAAYETVGFLLTKLVLNREVFSFSPFLVIFQVVLAVVCLGSMTMCPESPYWLASKGKLTESKKAFLWLRGKEGEKELLSVMEERRRPGPPKLYWMSLAIAIATLSVSIFTNTQLMPSLLFFYEDLLEGDRSNTHIYFFCSCIVAFSVVAFMSYYIKRKVLFLVSSGMSLLLSYTLALWMYLDPLVVEDHDSVFYYLRYFVFDMLLRCGSSALSLILCIEIIPQKYNTQMVCICFIFYYICFSFCMAILSYLFREYMVKSYVLIFVDTTLMLGGVILYYCFAPETKNKTLLEIQRTYTAEQSDSNPQQNQIMMQNVLYTQIASTIAASRVTVLVGAAGCGKSSRAPVAALRGAGGDAAVLVAGPRRVAAIGLARRVASELGEQVGDTVGYQVRLDSKPPRPPAGSILYCTSGILLRRLQTNPGLHGCTHVFIDEAHERDVNTDISLLLLKRAIDLNPDLKVIVMSATLDTEVFTRYFDPCPVIDVPGRTFPVQTSHLDEIRQKYDLLLSATLQDCGKVDGKPHVNCQEVVEVIKAVDRTEPEGAILVFLPGWAEIKQTKLLLDQCFGDTTHLILPIHSRLSTTDQAKMFSRPLPGVRKIVLATNIAETSVTIPDVVYVVDSGAHKENRLIEGTGIASLETVWVSQAGARQRAGRAGRLQPGHCYKLYTKEKENDFVPFTTPEILRVPLDQTVLNCKSYAPDEKIENFLSQLPEPPTQKAIQLAIEDLIDLGALGPSQRLSRLGAALVALALRPRAARGLLAGAALGAAGAAADVAARVAADAELFADAADRRREIREIKREFSATSDHVALLRIQEQFHQVTQERGTQAAAAWCTRYGLRRDQLSYVRSLSNLYLEQLLRTPVAQPSPDVEELNQFSGCDELIPAVLLCGANELLITKVEVKTKGKLMAKAKLVTSKGERAHLGSESVCRGASRARRALLAHAGGRPSRERRALVVRGASRARRALLAHAGGRPSRERRALVVRGASRARRALLAHAGGRPSRERRALVVRGASRARRALLAHAGGRPSRERRALVVRGASRARRALLAHAGGRPSRERRALVVRGASRVAPHAALLLCQGTVLADETYEDTTVLSLPRHKLKIHVPTSQVEHILRTREMFANTFQYYIEREPKEVSYEENSTVSRFKVELVKAISRMLVEANREFDRN